MATSLAKFQVATTFASALGSDEAGRKLLQLLKGKGLGLQGLRV